MRPSLAHFTFTASLVALLLPAARAQPPVDPPSSSVPLYQGLGPHTRKVSTASPEAQAYFNQGLNFLFAFNHNEAARSFRKAAELDPACAMAWWGLAISQGPHINHPTVTPEQARVALEALDKARDPTTKATQFERDLIDALALRCVADPPEDRSALDTAYSLALANLWEAHPDQADLGALYAESLMNLHPWDLYDIKGQPRPDTQKIVDLLEKVLALESFHPLANHLYIHAVEASANPERAADAADRLRHLQPGLSHNVHMPSHIDVRLGRWKQAIEANELAIEADRRFLALQPDPGFYGLYIAHNFHMLGFAAMMRGQSEKAIQAIDQAIATVPESWARENAAFADGYMIMPLEVRMRFGRWDEILAAPAPPEIFPLARALRFYARAVSLAAQGRVQEARAEREAFFKARAEVPEDAFFGNNKASDLLDVAQHLMSGEILYRQGDEEAAFSDLREAVKRQDQLRYSEPPDWIQPVRHALGAALMQSGRFAEAEQVYREDLERQPDNGWSLFGLMQSLQMQGNNDEAAKVRARWQEVWKEADVTLSSSCFCQPGI